MLALARVNSNVVRLLMLKTTLSVGILIAVSVVAGGSDVSGQPDPVLDQCPVLSVSCPEGVDSNSQLHAYASVSVTPAKLKFHWTVTWPTGVPKGRIESGQGTPALVISVPRGMRGSVTVTVKVTGWDPVCRNDASCSTMIERD